jgi:hypothetical protein
VWAQGLKGLRIDSLAAYDVAAGWPEITQKGQKRNKSVTFRQQTIWL